MDRSDFINSATRSYQPVGKCIFCPRTDNLTIEHIVPYFMGSTWELPAASCPACADVTKRFEQVCARDMFGDVRAQWKIYSRKKKDRRERFAKGLPNPLNIPNMGPPGPFAPLAMPIFEQPGLLSDLPKSEQIKVLEFEIVFPMIQGHQGPAKKGTVQIHSYELCRMLAKIAYTAAVAEFGLDLISNELVPYIHGSDRCISYIVGACPYPFPPHPLMKTDDKGSVQIQPFLVGTGIWLGNGRQLLVSRVQLFRFLNAPTYWVVVCPASERLIARVEVQAPQPAP